MKRIAVSAAVALSIFVATAPAGLLAQSREVPGMPMPPPMMPAYGMPPLPPIAGAKPSSPVEACLDMSAHGVAALAYLKARLDLTTAQLGAWQDVEAASTEIAKEQRDACARLPAKFEPPGAMQMLALGEERLATMQRHLQKIGPPSRKVYEVLSPDQRRVVDAMMPPLMLP